MDWRRLSSRLAPLLTACSRENELSTARGSSPMRFLHMYDLAVAIQKDRRRDEGRHDSAHHGASREAQPARVSFATRVRAAIQDVFRRDHSLTDYPCRLPDGRIGRVAVVQADGEWTLVCRVA